MNKLDFKDGTIEEVMEHIHNGGSLLILNKTKIKTTDLFKEVLCKYAGDKALYFHNPNDIKYVTNDVDRIDIFKNIELDNMKLDKSIQTVVELKVDKKPYNKRRLISKFSSRLSKLMVIEYKLVLYPDGVLHQYVINRK